MPIEVVEPTLASEAGHCAALLRGLRAAAPQLPLRVWIDRDAQLPHRPDPQTELTPHFSRRWRRLQAYALYRRLLRAGAPVFVPTASYLDLRMLDWAAPGAIAPGRAFLYFHKLRVSARRALALRNLAHRRPQIELFGTSEEIVHRLRTAGFVHVQQLLPVLAVAAAAPAAAPRDDFAHVLFAGAARADKGFTQVVDLVELMMRSGSALPIAVQTSGDHYGRYDERTLADLERLRALPYARLLRVGDTLDPARYAALFRGAICLQPYAPAEYADKMSAVTFDALHAGAPIVTVAGTTMARIVEQTGAGIVVSTGSAQELLHAIDEAVARYRTLHLKALAASAQLAPATSWAPLVQRLEAGLRAAQAGQATSGGDRHPL
jgi:glycosyltransferase involved in cell wall biosynthesis